MATSAPTFPADAPSLGEGRYVLVSRIGQGGVGAVYRTYDRKLRVWRAVKVLLTEAASHDWVREQFETDARTLAQIEHPGLVRIYDVGRAGSLPFVVMELVPGGSLSRFCAENGPLPPRAISDLVLRVVHGLGAIHAYGAVHGAVKPGNMLVASDGTVRLTDFGIVAPPDGSGHAAPEQLAGEPLDARTDIHGIGTTLWHLLRGQDPSGRTITYAGIDTVLHPVIRQCIEPDREARYASAERLAEALEDAAARLPLGRFGTTDLFVDRSAEELVVTPHAFGELDGLLDALPLRSRSVPSSVPVSEPERLDASESDLEEEAVDDGPELLGTGDFEDVPEDDEDSEWEKSDRRPVVEDPSMDEPLRPVEPLRATPSRGGTPRPAELIGLLPPAEIEPEDPPSRWTNWVVVPAAMATAALICVLLLLVIVGGTGMSSLSDAADATRTSQNQLYRVLNDEQAIVDSLGLLGADRAALEQTYLAYLEEDREPQRLDAALALVRTIDGQAQGQIDAAVEGTEYAAVAHQLRQIREARQHYDGAVTRWRAAVQAPTARMLVGVGLGPSPPAPR